MRVEDSTIRLTLAQRPGNFRASYVAGAVRPKASPIQVDAACTIKDDGKGTPNSANPRLASWKLGFMQARVLETNWAYYRGASPSDGCQLHDKVARQAVPICRDYDPALNHVWYEVSRNTADAYGVPDPAVKPPWPVTFHFGDEPQQDMPERVANPATGQANFLDEARVSMAFVTTLTELAGPGRFVHHRHFFWSVIWHFKAVGGPAAKGQGPFTLLPGSGFWISAFRHGAPVNSRYRAVLDDANLTPSCNDVSQGVSPVQHTATDWRRFPLMDKKDEIF